MKFVEVLLILCIVVLAISAYQIYLLEHEKLSQGITNEDTTTTNQVKPIESAVKQTQSNHCFNEIKDYDETLIDCGGSCRECNLTDWKGYCIKECQSKDQELWGFSEIGKCYCKPTEIKTETHTTIITTTVVKRITTTTTAISKTTIQKKEIIAERVKNVLLRIRGIDKLAVGSIFTVEIDDINWIKNYFTVEKKSSGLFVFYAYCKHPDSDFLVHIWHVEDFERLESSGDICNEFRQMKSENKFGYEYSGGFWNKIRLAKKYGLIRQCLGL